jgi:hypothetical protein
MKRVFIISLVILTVIALTACGSDTPEYGGWVTPEGSGADSIPTEATPTQEPAPTQEPTSTPRPTSTPVPDYATLYRDDAVAAVTAYHDARNAHDQAALERAMTASSAESGYHTIEQYQADSAMARGWSDFAHITIKEVTYIRCDEVLCKLNYVIHAVPPGDGTGNTAPFDGDDYTWVRLVDGVWLDDHSSETWSDEFRSTHRK